MSRFEVVTRKKTITKKKMAAFVEEVKKLGMQYGLDVELKVPDGGDSRADRLAAEMAAVEDARSSVEELRDELQEWYDNLPESFQGGDKGSELESAISELDSVIESLDSAVSEATSVSFPGMY